MFSYAETGDFIFKREMSDLYDDLVSMAPDLPGMASGEKTESLELINFGKRRRETLETKNLAENVLTEGKLGQNL